MDDCQRLAIGLHRLLRPALCVPQLPKGDERLPALGRVADRLCHLQGDAQLLLGLDQFPARQEDLSSQPPGFGDVLAAVAVFGPSQAFIGVGQGLCVGYCI
jgi:hypothetical protein